MSSSSQDGNAPNESRLGLLRELGEQAVLEAIFRRGPITRPEIASATELSKPTVSAAVGRLEQGGLIRATGRRTGQRGRSPVAYMVSKQVGFVVGSDIGGSNLRVAAADLFGEPICDLKQPTTKAGNRALGMQVLEMVTEVIDRASATHGRPLALAISTPGIIDQSTGRVTSLAYNVAPEGGFDPVEVIRDRLEMPVLVENNVNLAAVGEKWFGLARGVSTMVFISVGAGIGMGIVIDDQVVRGAHGAAGEIAYLPSAGDPFDPRHRLHGGLEDEIGAAGIVAAFNARRAETDPELSAAHEVFELATNGAGAARAVVDDVARRLGTAIAAVCAMLDPELVVLGGGIGSNPMLLSPVRGAAASLVPITARIETSLLGDRAALQGAVAVALNTARTSLLSAGGTPATRAQPALAAPRLA
jgi:predicted NBD/HSP70 family sugar kinase